jgi:hypothetical protein
MCCSSSQICVNEIVALHGFYAAYIFSCLQTFRDNISVPYSSLKIGPIGRPETSATNYQYTRRNIAEERRYHMQTCLWVWKMWGCLWNVDGRIFFVTGSLWKAWELEWTDVREYCVGGGDELWVWEQNNRLYKSCWALRNKAMHRQVSITAEQMSESESRSAEHQHLHDDLDRNGVLVRVRAPHWSCVTNITLSLGLMKFWIWIPALNSFRVLVPIPQLRTTTCASHLLHLSRPAPSYMLHLSDVIQHWPSFGRHRHTIFSFCVFCRQYCVVHTYIHT